jgi:hypothetical protein
MEEEVDAGLLDNSSSWVCRYVPGFWRNRQPPSSAVEMETVCFSVTLVNTNKSRRCYYQKTNLEIFTKVRI